MADKKDAEKVKAPTLPDIFEGLKGRLPEGAITFHRSPVTIHHTPPYRRCRFAKSSTAANKSLRVKSGHSFGVTYISV